MDAQKCDFIVSPALSALEESIDRGRECISALSLITVKDRQLQHVAVEFIKFVCAA